MLETAYRSVARLQTWSDLAFKVYQLRCCELESIHVHIDMLSTIGYRWSCKHWHVHRSTEPNSTSEILHCYHTIDLCLSQGTATLPIGVDYAYASFWSIRPVMCVAVMNIEIIDCWKLTIISLQAHTCRCQVQSDGVRTCVLHDNVQGKPLSNRCCLNDLIGDSVPISDGHLEKWTPSTSCDYSRLSLGTENNGCHSSRDCGNFCSLSVPVEQREVARIMDVGLN